MLVKSFMKEHGSFLYKAEVYFENPGYKIVFESPSGTKTVEYKGDSLAFVAEAAESWINGIRVLNG